MNVFLWNRFSTWIRNAALDPWISTAAVSTTLDMIAIIFFFWDELCRLTHAVAGWLKSRLQHTTWQRLKGWMANIGFQSPHSIPMVVLNTYFSTGIDGDFSTSKRGVFAPLTILLFLCSDHLGPQSCEVRYERFYSILFDNMNKCWKVK